MNKLVSLVGLCCIFLLMQCKPIQDTERFSAYRFPEYDRSHEGISLENYIIELIIDEQTGSVTYIIFPKITAQDTHMLIMRLRGGITKFSTDSIVELSAYHVYALEIVEGELYTCSYAELEFDCCSEKMQYGEDLRPYRIARWTLDNMAFQTLSKIKANKIFETKDYKQYWYIGDKIEKENIAPSKPESLDCVSFFYTYSHGGFFFPSPLIKLKNFSYKDFKNNRAVKDPSKKLYPALEALFTGKSIMEVDSLLKVGYKDLNQDTWKLEDDDGR